MTVDSFATYELIDTQWDVNLLKATIRNSTNDELIDTQWDVNLLALTMKKSVE